MNTEYALKVNQGLLKLREMFEDSQSDVDKSLVSKIDFELAKMPTIILNTLRLDELGSSPTSTEPALGVVKTQMLRTIYSWSRQDQEAFIKKIQDHLNKDL